MAAYLRQLFADTLSPNADVRKNAESQLKQAKKHSAHHLQVLELVASADASDAPIRQAAAVHFKNIVKNGWDESKDEVERDGITITAEARATIKTHLVELMCTVPPQIQAQISETISLIAEVDYPRNWENLLPDLVNRMKSPDLTVVNGVLSTANSIFKRFRYVQRSDELYSVILYTLPIIEEPLLTAYMQTEKAVQACTNDPQRLKLLFEALRLMTRIFYSLNYQDLPEFFEDHMPEWMEVFAKYLQYNNPVLVDDSEEDEPSPVDKLQAAIVENLKLYADKDEEPFIPFLPDFTKLVWSLLVGLTPYPKHDALVTTSIKFLSSLVAKKMHNALFQDESTLQQIVARIVVPNLMVRDADEEKFEDDPQEYILTEIEGSDSESRRKCSRDLLRAMCQQFEAQTTTIASSHVNSMLAEFSADNSKWAAKDTAIHLMLGIAIRLESYQGVSQINDNVDLIGFFSSHIFPELQDTNHNNRPMVKATALKFVCTFRKQFTTEQLVSLMPLMIAHLNSPSVVVHTLAAYGIERSLMTVDESAVGGKKYKISSSDLQRFLEPLFTGLFAIIDNTDLDENEHVMKCTMRSLARAGEDVIPVTGIFFNKLASALERVCKNPRNPSYNHYLFESIAALVRNVCSKEAAQTYQMEALLFPPFQIVLQMDVAEFTPYVFQVLAQLLEYRPSEAGLGDAYTALFPPLLTASLWESRGNIPGLVRLLSAYLKKAAGELVGSLVPFLGIFQKLNASKATEEPGFELLNAVTMYIPLQHLGQHMVTVFKIIMTKIAQGKSPKYNSLAIHYFALFTGMHGLQAFLEYTNQIQPGVGLSLLSQVWVPKIQSAATGRLGAKFQVVGVSRVLFDPSPLLNDENGTKTWAAALAGVLAILSSSTFSTAEHDGEPAAEIEIGYDSTFTKLSLAASKPDDPFASTTDPMRSFASSLQTFCNSKPNVLPALAASDAKFSAGLQDFAQKAGINLAL